VVGSREIPVSVPVAYPRDTQESFEPVIMQDPFKQQFRTIAFGMYEREGDSSFAPPVEDEEGPAGDNYIPGLLVIPGNAQYLKSHFEVVAIVANAAPDGFDVTASNLTCRLVLPPSGQFGLPLTVGQSLNQEMADYGPDGQADTADDQDSIGPGQRARAEYVVIGERPGVYPIEVEIQGRLSLPQESSDVTIVAESQIIVRSPEFSVHFEHPDAVAEGEIFDMSMTFTNTGEIPLEDFSLALDGNNLVGARLHNTPELQTLESIPPGTEATLTYTLESLTNGVVYATYFKLPDNVQGSMALTVGIGQAGQRITENVLTFPAEFDSAFSGDLVTALKRFTKTALDFSQADPADLPGDLLPITGAGVRSMAENLILTARETSYGISQQEQILHLLSGFMRSQSEVEELDRIRRRFIDTNETTDIETAFGAA